MKRIIGTCYLLALALLVWAEDDTQLKAVEHYDKARWEKVSFFSPYNMTNQPYIKSISGGRYDASNVIFTVVVRPEYYYVRENWHGCLVLEAKQGGQTIMACTPAPSETNDLGAEFRFTIATDYCAESTLTYLVPGPFMNAPLERVFRLGEFVEE